jgi:hypothetical protein
MKYFSILITLIVNISMSYSQDISNNLYKKWLVYNTTSNALNGWNSFNDSYILDFTNPKILKIKTLGEQQIETVEYSFNHENGVIYEKNGEILYKTKELNSDKLILIMGDDNNVNVYLTRLENSEDKISLDELTTLLKKKKWNKGSNRIEFNNETYLVADEIETNYKVFEETNEIDNKSSKSAWLIDTYDNIVFLELFSEKFNHKAIYVVRELNNISLKANAFDKNGEFLLFELDR